MNSCIDLAQVKRLDRKNITAAYRADETACVAALAEEMERRSADGEGIAERARELVAAVRRQRQGASGVDHLMHEFSLSSQEGIALMCLAEALLRIPDAATMDRLIRDKISKGDWRAHLGNSSSLFVNAATWGLMITGSLVATHSEKKLGNTLARLIGRGGEPMIRRGVEFAMGLLGQQFVMGESIGSALARSEANVRKGYTHSFDMLGEAAISTADAERYIAAYVDAIHAIGKASNGSGVIGGPGISVKLSALHPRYSRAQRQRVMDELYPRLLHLARLACDYEIGLSIDAEEADRLELSLDLVDRLAFEPALAAWEGLGIVVQAYQKRCPAVIEHLARLARVSGRRLMVRLVKGAYWDSEIKRAQVDGLEGYPVYTRKVHTDLSYLVCAGRLLDAADVIYPQFATHNAHTLATVANMAERMGVEDYEFQCLHGMGEALYNNVVAPGAVGGRCRIYAPVGSHETLLPYLVRRLLENGANSSFVNRIVDERVSIDELIVDPLRQIGLDGGLPHPGIPLPPDLYGGERRNSAGLDLSNENELSALAADLETLRGRAWHAVPLLAGGPALGGNLQDVTNPARRGDRVGTVVEAGRDDAQRAVTIATAYADRWNEVPARERARMLRACADSFEARRNELISLCIREAGKTWSNALAEIREAVDFCRYYAALIERIPAQAKSPGVVVCISPWNFPLAIFVGEITAALASGSPVIAKPAEQTPLIAAHAVRLMHAAGIPEAALQFLPGRGEVVGAALVGEARIGGVIFTGSTEVAQLINRELAARPARFPAPCLIAETGGQNAMIVDSSALPEQVVLDVINSAFDSAGQRCSALRVLCLQEEIADQILATLKSAMRELSIGDPADLSCDIGPVIDDEARSVLLAHIARMRASGRPVYQCEMPAACAAGSYVPPTVIEIESLDDIEREVFGPIVHVLRFAASGLDRMVDAINATGYGLTFGMHSRIDESIERVTSRLRVGNLYINRNMVGAVVGVQPFGGEGKSGTGPKAGGPFYLPRILGLANVRPESIGLVRDDGDEAQLAPFSALVTWAHQQGLAALAHACAEYAAVTPLRCRADLPGPTGERNTLRFSPRGVVLCLAESEGALLEQIAATLATGNRPMLIEDRLSMGVAERLPEAVRARLLWRRPGGADRPDAILCAGAGNALPGLRERTAAQGGAIVPVITPASADFATYPLYRLVCEHVLSVNTTAAGGNTSLMTLGA